MLDRILDFLLLFVVVALPTAILFVYFKYFFRRSAAKREKIEREVIFEKQSLAEMQGESPKTTNDGASDPLEDTASPPPLPRPKIPPQPNMTMKRTDPEAYAEITKAAGNGDKVALAIQQIDIGGQLNRLLPEPLELSEDLPPARIVLLREDKHVAIFPPETPNDIVDRHRKAADYQIVFSSDGAPTLSRPLSDYITDAIFNQS